MNCRLAGRSRPIQDGKQVLLIANNVWNIANFRIQLVEHLVKSGYTVTCVADSEDFWPEGGAAERIRGAGARLEVLPIERRGTNPLTDLLLARSLTRIIRSARPDLVISYTLKPVVYGTIVARLRRVPAVAVLTGLGSAVTRSDSFAGRVSKLMLRVALPLATAVLVMNDSDREWIIDNGLASSGKVLVLPGEGVDTKWFRPRPRSPEIAPVFLFVGRLLGDKGVHEFVEAASMLRRTHPQVRFQLGGNLDPGNPTAIDAKTLSDWIASGVIEYLGTTNDPRDWYQQASVIVTPSYREGLNRVLMEGLSSGLAAVATDVPGCRELVVDGVNGFLCRPRDPNSLLRALTRMAEMDGEERSQMGRRGRRVVEAGYAVERIVSYYLAVLPRWVGDR